MYVSMSLHASKIEACLSLTWDRLAYLRQQALVRV